VKLRSTGPLRSFSKIPFPPKLVCAHLYTSESVLVAIVHCKDAFSSQLFKSGQCHFRWLERLRRAQRIHASGSVVQVRGSVSTLAVSITCLHVCCAVAVGESRTSTRNIHIRRLILAKSSPPRLSPTVSVETWSVCVCFDLSHIPH